MTPASTTEPWLETVDWCPVSSRLIWVEQLHVLAVTVIAGGVAAVAAGLLGSAGPLWLAAAAVGLGLLRAALVGRSVRAWGYAERDTDLLVRRGLMLRRLSIVPYARMQFVDVTAGPVERLFGLATVQLHTASPVSNARIRGLAGPEAARLRDRLTALGQARAEGL